MRPDESNRVLRQQPFRPFRVHLSNGGSYDVRHPELAMVDRHTMVVGQAGPDLTVPVYDDFFILDLVHVNDLEPLPLATPPTTNGPAQ